MLALASVEVRAVLLVGAAAGGYFLVTMLADLIPDSLFQGITAELWLWMISVGAIALLVFGADRAVTGAVKLASSLGMSRVIIGATVVSLGTTAPETFVSVTAAFEGKPGLALGNGVGSVICNAALIFGLCSILKPLPKDRFVMNRHGWLQLVAGASLAGCIAILALLGGGQEGVTIGRAIGVFFLVLLGAYLYLSVRWARQHPEAIRAPAGAQGSAGHRARSAIGNLALLAVGLALVIVGARVLIGAVSELGVRYQVPANILAVTLVAFGTSLPELVTGIVAIVKGHAELLVGNVMGANILNIWFVIGASATAVPLAVDREFFYMHVPVMIVALLLMALYGRGRGTTFRRWQGVPLLAVFIGYYLLLVSEFSPAQ